MLILSQRMEDLNMDFKLFDIIVFNRSIEEFNKYWDQRVKRNRRDETDDEWKNESWIYKDLIGRNARPLNSVVGYIHIYLSGGIDLITTLDIDCRERMRLDGAPDIRYDPSTFTRTRTNKHMSSKEILDTFNKDLLNGCNERLKRRYIDLEAWNNFSKSVDWHEVIYSCEEQKTKKNTIEEIQARYKMMNEELPAYIEPNF